MQHGQNGLSYVPKKLLTWVPREAAGGFKATVGNRVRCLSQFHWVHPPTFESCPGAREFDKGRDFVENEIEASKK